MEVPVLWRDPALLPVQRAGIVFDCGPDLLRSELEVRGEPSHGVVNIHPDQYTTDVEDDGAEFRGWHGLNVLGAGGRGRASRTEDADDCGKNGKDDDNGNDVVNALSNVGNRTSKDVAAEDHRANPQNTSTNVKEEIAGIRHFRSAGDRRTERPNDGDEAREDHGTAAIFLVEIMSPLKMAAAEEERVLAAVESHARRAADPIANLIADDGAKHNRQQEPLEGNHTRGGKNPGGDEQGITGKKEADEKTSFNEDDRADQRSAAGAD